MSGRDLFLTTRWTVVLQAAREQDTQRAQAALSELCTAYWFPLYAYTRRRGYSPHDAEDLTQGFFARLLRLNSLATIRREGGKFRAFLLASLKHFIADEWARASAQKRSAPRKLPLNAEQRYESESPQALSPEELYERQWAFALLEQVLAVLKAEYERTGRGLLFEALRFAISGERSTLPYAALAEQLSLSEEAVKVAVHRLRQRYRKTLRQEIARTVANDAEAEEELLALRRILAG